MSLPLIAVVAALLYFLAAQLGWLEALSRLPKPGRRSEGRSVRPAAKSARRADDRLEVFEDFLKHLGRDDTDRSE